MKTSPSLKQQVFVFTAARTVLNTVYRMVYPFLSTFARGLGVEITTLSLVFTARSLIGFLGVFLAPIADRRGRKVSLLLGLGLMTVSALLISLFPVFPVFFIGMVFSTLGSMVFIPAMQALLSDQTPFKQRGRVLGFTELSWSLSFILGIPFVGWIISLFSRSPVTEALAWRSPFPFLALFGVAAMLLIYRTIPNSSPLFTESQTAWRTILDLLKNPAVLAGLVFGISMSCANEVVNFIFGVWLEDQFQLKLVALGAASAVIGISELGGEGLSTLFVDRVGKTLAVRIGLVGSMLASIFLFLFSATPFGALSGLFLFYISFEFLIVSGLPLISALHPKARATLMALTMSSFSLGRALGAFLSPRFYQGGFFINLIAAIVFYGIAFVCLWWMRPDEDD